MPLTQSSVPRRAVHSRVVTCQGYQREDGLWDIEGQLMDTKPFALPNTHRGGYVNAGEALHGMMIRLTIDAQMTVHAVDAVIEHSPFKDCPTIVQRMQQIVGLAIVPGWTRKIKELFAGQNGCTHLTELLGPIATTAFQVVITHKMGDGTQLAADVTQPPPHLNTCHMLAESSAVVAERWPQFYRPKSNS